MTNRNYLLIIAAGLFMVIFSMVVIKIIFDTPVNITPAYREYIDKTFHKFYVYKGQNKKFPDAIFFDPKGEPVNINNFRGQYLLLNLWATWCPGCVKELPSLSKLQQYAIQKDYPVSIVALSLDREKSITEIAQFLVDNKIGPFALYHDRNKVVMRAYPTEGLPTTLLIDPEGYVLYEFMGEADWSNYFLIKFLREEMDPFIKILEKEDSP